jgi:hypothetical protein
MVDARIPESMIPPVNAGINPKELMYLEISTIIVSAAEPDWYAGRIPFCIRE